MRLDPSFILTLTPEDLVYELGELLNIRDRIEDCWEERHEEDSPYLSFEEKYPINPFEVRGNQFVIYDDPDLLKEFTGEIEEEIDKLKHNIRAHVPGLPYGIVGETPIQTSTRQKKRAEEFKTQLKSMMRAMAFYKRILKQLKKKLFLT